MVGRGFTSRGHLTAFGNIIDYHSVCEKRGTGAGIALEEGEVLLASSGLIQDCC